jgi:outer membrane protein insertion porin family
MMAAKLRHAFLYVFMLFLLVGRSTFSIAEPTVASPIEGVKSILVKQSRVVSEDAGSQSTAKTGPIVLAQNSAAPPAAGRTDLIAEISVEGSLRVDPATVISYMKLKVGDRYEREKLDESLKSLFSTGYFRDVKFRRDGNILFVEVKENPVINRIAFEGNKRIKDEILQAELKLKPRLVYTVNKVQTDAERIAEVYRRSGRFAAKVEPKLIELDQNRVDLVFEIDEGDRTKVRRIVFVGNKQFSDRQLRSEIRTTESRWYKFFTSDDIYDPDRVAYDQTLLRNFYLKNGFVNFQVINSVAELTKNKDGFIITFTLEEGDRYEIGSVGFKSNFPGVDILSFKQNGDLLAGDYYNSETVDEVVDNLTKAISESGVSFFEVLPKVSRRDEEKLVDIVIDVVPAPNVYVGRIDINGNVRTLDRVIRREIQLAEGDAVNQAKIRESERRVRRLGFFDSVKIETVPSRVSDRVNIAVTVVEKSTGELSFGAGVTSDTGVIGNVSIRERNLLGKGQDLALSFALSADNSQLDLSFTEPYFLDRPLLAGVDVFASDQDKSSESAYKEKAVGGGLRVGYELAPRWRQNWGYLLKDTDVSASSGASRFVQAQNGKATTSKLTHSIGFDNTNNALDPSEGLRLSWSAGLAGLGGSVNYFTTQAKVSKFFPLAPETVLQLSTRGGAVFGLGDDVRLVDRFFLGGTNFRGFALSGIGARDSATGDALGGNYYYFGSAELTFPLGLPKDIGIRGRAFIDAGAVFDTDDTGSGIDDSSDPRVAIGFGFTWASVMGPIRLDWSYTILKEDFDKDQVFSFTFGTRF